MRVGEGLLKKRVFTEQLRFACAMKCGASEVEGQSKVGSRYSDRRQGPLTGLRGVGGDVEGPEAP